MPVPKRRHSKTRTRKKRNGHYFSSVINAIKCVNCGAFKLPHAVCSECSLTTKEALIKKQTKAVEKPTKKAETKTKKTTSKKQENKEKTEETVQEEEVVESNVEDTVEEATTEEASN